MQISAPKNPYSRRILDNTNSSDALEGNRTGGSDPISSVLQTFRPSSSSSVWETATEALFSAMTERFRDRLRIAEGFDHPNDLVGPRSPSNDRGGRRVPLSVLTSALGRGKPLLNQLPLTLGCCLVDSFCLNVIREVIDEFIPNFELRFTHMGNLSKLRLTAEFHTLC